MPTSISVNKASIVYFSAGNEKIKELALRGPVRFTSFLAADAAKRGFSCPIIVVSGADLAGNEKDLIIPLDGDRSRLVISDKAAFELKFSVGNRTRGFVAFASGAPSPLAAIQFLRCVREGRDATQQERSVIAGLKGLAAKPSLLFSVTVGSSSLSRPSSAPPAPLSLRATISTASTAAAPIPSKGAVRSTEAASNPLPPAVASFSSEQRHVLLAIQARKNVFCSGGGGSGKTFLLQHLQAHVLPPSSTVFTATTSAAALLINGLTIHAWAGLTPEITDAFRAGRCSADAICEKIKKERPYAVDRWNAVEFLVIDEISMLDDSTFTLLDQMGRAFRRRESKHRPWGGLTLLCSGDFCQLPPVIEGSSGGDKPCCFAFLSPSWDRTFSLSIELKTVFRQAEDAAFARMLGEIRKGRCSEATTRALQACYRPSSSVSGGASSADGRGKERDETSGVLLAATHLHTHVKAVEKENAAQLAALPGALVEFHCADEVRQPDYSSQKITQRCPAAAPVVSLKKGAQVMLTRALDQSAGLVNGSRGVVIGFEPPSYSLGEVKFYGRLAQAVAAGAGSSAAPASASVGLPIVFFPNAKPSKDFPGVPAAILKELEAKGKLTIPKGACDVRGGLFIAVKPLEFVLRDYSAPLTSTSDRGSLAGAAGVTTTMSVAAIRRQLPLALAWAVSIHRSQGATLDLVNADLSKVFEFGQAYVSLSRCKSLKSLTLSAPFDPAVVKAHPLVVEFYDRLAKANASSSSSLAGSDAVTSAGTAAPAAAVAAGVKLKRADREAAPDSPSTNRESAYESQQRRGRSVLASPPAKLRVLASSVTGSPNALPPAVVLGKRGESLSRGTAAGVVTGASSFDLE